MWVVTDGYGQKGYGRIRTERKQKITDDSPRKQATKASIRLFVPCTHCFTTPHVPPLFSVDVLLLIFISSTIKKDDSRGGNNVTLKL